MTLAQINETLPNGFHDAEIEQFIWDFSQDTAVLKINFWTATEEDQDPEKYQRGIIEIHKIVFIAVDPPDPAQYGPKPYRGSGGTLQIDGMVADEKIFPMLSQLKPSLPSEIEVFSFYVENWNSFLHIAAAEAILNWS
jgi:hypothetical protein